MKFIYTFLTILFFGLSVQAQDYAPVYTNQMVHFFPNPSIPFQTYVSPHIIGLRTDSFIVQSQDTIIFGYKTRPDTVTPYGCDPAGISLQGPRIIKSQQFTYFFNRNLDTIRFKHSGIVGDTWELFQLDNDSTINAHIYKKDTLTIDGMVDSVTYVSLIMSDSIGSNIFPVNSPSNDTLIVSKHLGILNFKSWLNYPDTSSREKTYKTNITIPTRGAIYDFNIGDEFHYRYTYTPPSGPPVYFNIVYLNKWYSNQQDTLYYERLVKSESISVDFSTNPPTVTTHTGQAVDTVFYTDLNSEILSGAAKQMSASPNSFMLFSFLSNTSNQLGYITNLTPKRKQGNRVMIEGHYGFGYDNQNDCYYSSNPLLYFTFGEGLGVVWDYSDGGIGAPREGIDLIYYQKSNEVWGTPHTITVGIKAENNFKSFIQIYPNPTSGQVSLKGLKEPTQIRLYDLNGRLLLEKTLDPNSQIDLSSLEKGIYLLEIDREGELIRKKVVKN